jgi:outer membrane protein
MPNVSKLIASVLAAGLMLAAGSAVAQSTGKIATIRAAELVQSSPQFKAGQVQMKSEFDKRKSDLEAEAKKLGDDLQKFKREQDVMSADARSKTEKDLNTRKIDFDYKQRQFGEDFQKRDKELTESMMGKIKAVIEAVAKEKGVDVVVQDPVYATASTDITDEVLKRLQAGGGAK